MHASGLFIRSCAVACAFALAACDVYDSSLLRESSPSPNHDAGMDAATGVDGGDAMMMMSQADGAVSEAGTDACVPTPEICNGKDDDCDGTTDEDTLAYCESIVVHAETKCLAVAGTRACAKIACSADYWDCDGIPSNGCESAYCDCHDRSDAGSGADAGAVSGSDAGGEDAGP